jgi:hypothetical protein
MRKKLFIKIIGIFLMLCPQISLFFLPISLQVHAQTTDIPLQSPYYGSLGLSEIQSYFDHNYPTYRGIPNCVSWTPQWDCLLTNNNVVRWDGDDQTGNVSIELCDINPLYCYDGHDGIDFGLTYQPVLAAADGDVAHADWEVDLTPPYCHDGNDCKLGLYVEIDHTYNGISN